MGGEGRGAKNCISSPAVHLFFKFSGGTAFLLFTRGGATASPLCERSGVTLFKKKINVRWATIRSACMEFFTPAISQISI